MVDYTRHPPFGSHGRSLTPLMRGPPPPPPQDDLLLLLVLEDDDDDDDDCADGTIRFHSV